VQVLVVEVEQVWSRGCHRDPRSNLTSFWSVDFDNLWFGNREIARYFRFRLENYYYVGHHDMQVFDPHGQIFLDCTIDGHLDA
jgi:hypothetical protein